VVQIETEEAVGNADDIAAVTGVDVLFVGPLDLSVNMDMVRQFDNPTYVEALKKVATACKRHKKAAGILVPKQDLLPKWFDMGYTFFVVGSDSAIIANGLANLKSFYDDYK
jgi:4-hydroxy-2-oxoheptanedioate aldolase